MKRSRKNNTSSIESSKFQSFFSKDTMGECPLCGTFMKQKDLYLHASTCSINDIDDLFPPSLSMPTQELRGECASQPVMKQQKVNNACLSAPNSTQKASSSSEKKVNASNNAFNKMINASKESREKRFIFRLDLVDNRLLYDITDEHDNTDGKENTVSTAWEEKVNLRGLPMINELVTSPNVAVILRTNIEGTGLMSLSEEDDYKFAKKRSDTYVIGILKSILQKAVRRRNSEAARRVAATIMRLSMDDLLRRLPIIMVEDSLFNPEFVIIVFLMMAHSKGYRIPMPLLHIVVKFTEDIAACRHKEPEVTEEEEGEQQGVNVSQEGDDDEEVTPAAPRALALALLFRCSYGGVRGDMEMLVETAKRTLQRFKSSSRRSQKGSICSNLLLIPSIKSCLHHSILKTLLQYPWGEAVLLNQFSSTKIDLFLAEGQSLAGDANPIKHLSNDVYPLRREDLLPVGVDFHCDPALITHLVSELQREQNSELLLRIMTIAEVDTETNPGLVENAIHDLLKRCIWIFRSSVNHRTPLSIALMKEGEGIDAGNTSAKIAELSVKKKLGPVWNAIAKMTNQYCISKCNALFMKIQ